jgi:hypothetical protein
MYRRFLVPVHLLQPFYKFNNEKLKSNGKFEKALYLV